MSKPKKPFDYWEDFKRKNPRMFAPCPESREGKLRRLDMKASIFNGLYAQQAITRNQRRRARKVQR